MQHCMQISAAVQADSAKIIMMHVVDLGEAIFKKILLFYNSETSYFISLLAKKNGKCFFVKKFAIHLPFHERNIATGYKKQKWSHL